MVIAAEAFQAEEHYVVPVAICCFEATALQTLQAATGLYGLALSSKRQAATHEVDISLGPMTARAAFSHIPFWQSVAGMTGCIVKRPTPGNPVAAPAKTPQQVLLSLNICFSTYGVLELSCRHLQQVFPMSPLSRLRLKVVFSPRES